jgi:hypothetical protein
MTERQERLYAGQDATLARRREPLQGVREVLEVRKRDGLQRLTDERAEARYVTPVRALRVGTAAVQPQLEQLLVAAGLLVGSRRDPALVNGTCRMQDNVSSHAFRIQEQKGINKNTLCYTSV